MPRVRKSRSNKSHSRWKGFEVRWWASSALHQESKDTFFEWPDQMLNWNQSKSSSTIEESISEKDLDIKNDKAVIFQPTTPLGLPSSGHYGVDIMDWDWTVYWEWGPSHNENMQHCDWKPGVIVDPFISLISVPVRHRDLPLTKGGEFNNEDIKDMAENFRMEISTTAAYSLPTGAITINLTGKLTKIEHSRSSYQHYQCSDGIQTFPFLVDRLPTLEVTTVSAWAGKHMTLLHAAGKAFRGWKFREDPAGSEKAVLFLR